MAVNQFELKNKTILITGASSGIGRETAILISKMGATVVVSGRDEGRLNATFDLLEGHGHKKIICDLTDEKQMDKLVEEMPGINGLVYSAGIVRPFPIKFIGKKQIDEMYSINYNSPVILCGKLFKSGKILKDASIVFISSVSSQYSHKGGALYAGAKAGLESFSRTIALEYADKKIRSNCIRAAMVKTPLFNESEKVISKELMDEHGKRYPLGFGEPIDIANGAVFLLSDASKWITGTCLVMDGGLTAGQ